MESLRQRPLPLSVTNRFTLAAFFLSSLWYQNLSSLPKTAKYVQGLPNYPRIPLSQKYPQISPLASDLLEKIFVYEPERRISAVEALHHPYFQDLPYPREDVGFSVVFHFICLAVVEKEWFAFV